ncbi:MAG: DNA-processing protein DprA [Clostridia bacterium]|nr:DNA-processing protein DprA [Clostridia bacterium]
MWVWLATRYSSFSNIPKRIIEHFKDPFEAFNATEEEYKTITRSYETLLDKDIRMSMDIVEYIKKNNIGIITYDMPQFPQRLKKLENCPIVLYYIGNLYDFDNSPQIGVVGTRNYTAQGERVTKRISYDLARSGFTIVSGLAKGIDSFSHKAALYNRSATIAVLGCGIDVIYPKENRELTMRIRENGLVLTEFHPGTKPLAYNFPARNRIISSLSDGVVVTECSIKSGTMITAEHALEHNIPVYMIDDLCSDSVGYLRERGAVSVKTSDDITRVHKSKFPGLKFLGELPKETVLKPKESVITVSSFKEFNGGANVVKAEKPETVNNKQAFSEFNDTEKEIINMLLNGPLFADEIVNDKLPMKTVLYTLTSLEFKNAVISLPGGKYAINKQ